MDISKIPISISFKKSIESKETDFAVVYKPVLNALGVILANFENIRVVLPKVQIYHETNSFPVLQEKIKTLYKAILFNVVLKLLGSANIIGNPLNFYTKSKLE